MRYIVRTTPGDRLQRAIARTLQDAWDRLLDLDLVAVAALTALMFVLWLYCWWRFFLRRPVPPTDA